VLVRHAAAVDDQAVLGSTVPKAICAATAVGAQAEAIDGLQQVVKNAAQDLRRQGLLARTASITARYADGAANTRCTSLREPTSADDELMLALRRLLPRLLKAASPVVRLEVSLAALVRAERQLSLFGRRSAAALPGVRRA
jgi:site-specific recombinase